MPDPINWSIALPYLGLAFMVGYLFGSIPFGPGFNENGWTG